MFTYIELENFKSFKKIKFDLKKNKKSFKRFIAIYGENGSGKSNFVSAIELLSCLVTSFINLNPFEEYKQKIQENIDNKDFVKKILQDINNNSIASKLKSCRMIDCEEPTKITYGFSIDNIEGHYSIVFSDEAIIEENLYYLSGKQRGVLYKVFQKNNAIHSSFSSYTFQDIKYKNQILELIDMYWGKHTLLSLLLNELKSKNADFINKNMSQNLLKVIHRFMHVFIVCKASNAKLTGIISGSNIFISDFERVTIKASDTKKKNQLDKIEKIIKNFYTQAYTDIVDIYYEIDSQSNDENKEYILYVKKIIANKVRTIPFSLESAGTQRILSVLRAVVEAINGQTVIYDEIDDGIHDLLMCNILLSLQDEIEGQLIITTHNTLLLEDLDPKSAYVIYLDSNGNKEARCIDDYDKRIQPSNNQRKLYLNGVFGGVPYTSEIDYSDNVYKLKNLEE